MPSLDQRFPSLSQLVEAEYGFSLEHLAKRARATQYDYFDLERLLAHTLDDDRYGLADGVLAPHAAQVRGYIATLEAYVALGIVKNPRRFVAQKLMVPATPRPLPVGSEMLDTLAECSWALWLHDRYGNVEEEKPLPGGVGDADFFVVTAEGNLWVDSISVAPTADQSDLSEYFSKVVTRKWKQKFGALLGATSIRSAIAVTLLKNQENALARLHFDQATGQTLSPQSHVWTDCSTLQTVWLGLPPFHERAHRPDIFATWNRP